MNNVKFKLRKLAERLVMTGDLKTDHSWPWALRRVTVAALWSQPMFQEGLIALGCRP